MSAPVLIIEVQFSEPGGEHLARHLREPLESAVVNEVAALSDLERRGLRVSSRIVGPDGIDSDG